MKLYRTKKGRASFHGLYTSTWLASLAVGQVRQAIFVSCNPVSPRQFGTGPIPHRHEMAGTTRRCVADTKKKRWPLGNSSGHPTPQSNSLAKSPSKRGSHPSRRWSGPSPYRESTLA
jgi:hypothetical protein